MVHVTRAGDVVVDGITVGWVIRAGRVRKTWRAYLQSTATAVGESRTQQGAVDALVSVL